MMSKSYRLEAFDDVVKANTIHNFKLNFFSDSISVDSIWDLIKFITTCTSQTLVWLLAYSKPWYNIAGFASMVLLRLLNALVRVISCLTLEGSGKTLGKRNSLCGSQVLTAHLLLCCMDRFHVTYLGNWWDTQGANLRLGSLTRNTDFERHYSVFIINCPPCGKIPGKQICSGHWGDVRV